MISSATVAIPLAEAEPLPDRFGPFQSLAVAVGSNEEAGALVGCPHVGCSKQAPSRIEPEVGQVPENLPEPE